MPVQQEEIALAQELLSITHEGEVDRFLPLLLPLLKIPAMIGLKAAPLMMKAAAPLVKKLAVGAVKAIPKLAKAAVKNLPDLGGGGGDTGGGDDGEFGFAARAARRFGTTWSRTNPRDVQVDMSLRFVRAARWAARRAAVVLARLSRRGAPLGERAVRRVVYRALMAAVRARAPFLLPTMRAVALSFRAQPAYFGSTLPRPRVGRIFTPATGPAPRRAPGSTGVGLPTPRGRTLGAPRPVAGPRPRATACRACAARRAEMEGGMEMEMPFAQALTQAPAGPGVYSLQRGSYVFSTGQTDNLRRRFQQHQASIQRLCGSAGNVLVTFTPMAGSDYAARRREELARRAAAAQAQGRRTRDQREHEAGLL